MRERWSEDGSTVSHDSVWDEKQRQRLLEISEISLWLDSYDDIFSDFDSRHYSERALSQDFLGEARRASRDKASGSIELKFLVPSYKRSPHHEMIIKKRLREHFRKHYLLLQKESKGIVKKGLIFTAVGIALMFIASYILFTDTKKTYMMHFLIVLLEPAGWFLFWEGMHMAMFDSKAKSPDFDFYKKMARCEIYFLSYD